jgi:Zn-finger nucleic acid-binding protein
LANCPRCFEENALAYRGGAPEVRGCAACKGVWLSQAAAKRLIEGPFGPLSGLPTLATRASLCCPDCGATLERRQVAGVEIDVCPRDGVWFDHTEVERVQAAARRPRGDDGLATAGVAVLGTAVAAEVVAATIYAPMQRPGPQAAQADGGALVDVADGVIDVGATAIDVAASGTEVVGAAIVDGGAVEVVGAALDGGTVEVVGATVEAGAGALDVLASIFEGIFNF